jgi:hypothetical protein
VALRRLLDGGSGTNRAAERGSEVRWRLPVSYANVEAPRPARRRSHQRRAHGHPQFRRPNVGHDIARRHDTPMGRRVRARDRHGPARGPRSPRQWSIRRRRSQPRHRVRQRSRVSLGRATGLMGATSMRSCRAHAHARRVARRPPRARLRARVPASLTGSRIGRQWARQAGVGEAVSRPLGTSSEFVVPRAAHEDSRGEQGTVANDCRVPTVPAARTRRLAQTRARLRDMPAPVRENLPQPDRAKSARQLVRRAGVSASAPSVAYVVAPA